MIKHNAEAVITFIAFLGIAYLMEILL